MKKIIRFWAQTNTVIKITVGLLIGVVLGLFVPEASIIGLLGDVFVKALKSIAPILVFVLVTSALVNCSTRVGSKFKLVIIFYTLTTFIASFVAVVVCDLIPVTFSLTNAHEMVGRSDSDQVLSFLLDKLLDNPISALTQANYIGILFWAVLFGLSLKIFAKESTHALVTDIADAISKIVGWVIGFAPFGVLGLVYTSITESGFSVFVDYGQLLLVLVGTMIFCSLIINPLIVFIFLGRNPYPLIFKCLRGSAVTAFFTRSSAANIPINMQLCKRLGLNKDFYSVSIPLGAMVNLDSSAITINILTLALCHTLGIEVDFITGFVLSILVAIASCGASGVVGGSMLLIPMAASIFGISNDIAMYAVSVGFIIGVVQDSFETAFNSSEDVLFTATTEYYYKKKNNEPFDFNYKC